MSVVIESAVGADVPESAFECDQPMVAVMRGEHVGSLHRGTFAVAGASGDLLLALGDPAQPAYLRSAAKPFQIMPALLAGAVDRFDLSDRELAVLCASHSAEPRHTDTILGILARAGLEESALHCGVHPPLNERTAIARWEAGQEPTPVCNNCSGAHTGMLLACVLRGWSLEDYGSPQHPLQRETRGIVAAFAGLQPGEVDLATDNCHVPTFRLPISHAAQAFARLASGSGVGTALEDTARLVVRAMTGNPGMVAGEGRFDTDLMTAAEGAVLAKGGAEGFQGVGLIEKSLGLAIKVSDGNARAIPPAVLAVLEHLDVLSDDALAVLDAYRTPASTDLQGEIVGQLLPVFTIGRGRV